MAWGRKESGKEGTGVSTFQTNSDMPTSRLLGGHQTLCLRISGECFAKAVDVMILKFKEVSSSVPGMDYFWTSEKLQFFATTAFL
ncbi:hypothetical protein BaRGS_00019622 [Batillaria attramentaria]|uniref:Uncharacterized protein n=1 Tax=Batillaria attramentaria TaxID=370345 RepID=A0ABD0KQ37_9CAEN